MLCSLTNLNDQDLNAIQELEASLDKPLLAFTCRTYEAAELTSEELGRIQDLENRLGISLLAVGGT